MAYVNSAAAGRRRGSRTATRRSATAKRAEPTPTSQKK